MLNKESIFTGVLTLWCMIYLYFAFQMPFGSWKKPDSAFVPVIFGVAGLILAIGLFANAIVNKGNKVQEQLSKDGVLRLLSYLAMLLIYILIFQTVGAVASTFIVTLTLSKISGFKGWAHPILLAFICSAATYFLFEVALGVPLPKGPLF